MPLEMLKVESVDILKKSKSSLCDEGLITALCPHWDAQATNLSNTFFVPRFRNSIGCNCNAIMITAGATTFSLIENRKIQLNAISHRCQTNTGDLEISTSFECLMCAVQLMCCACLIRLDIPQASSIALFFSETKWQFKRWISSLLHSKSLFTPGTRHS